MAIARRAALTALILVPFLPLAGCATAAKPDLPEPNTLSQRPDRSIVELDNGLVVIAQRIETAPVASVQCWVKAGSIYERRHNGAGISHYLEHLVSGGTTTTRSEEETSRILGRIGAQTNAATSLQTVRYYVNTSDEHAGTAVDLVSDWMQNAKITADEFRRERQVILREFQMGRGEPSRIFWKLTQQARYRTHPARNPTIGYLNRFKKLTRQDVRGYYEKMYVPNNMVFLVTGDIEPRKIVRRVQRRWRDEPSGDVPGVLLPEERDVGKPRTVTGRADIDRPRLRLAWPGTRLQGEGDYALDLLGRVLGQGELSRLVQQVRDEKQLATSIEAYNLSFDWGRGFFGIDATVPAGKMKQAKRAILDVVERLKVHAVTEAELKRARRKTIAETVFSTQTAQETASRMAGDFIRTANPDYLDHYAKAIKRVTRGEVQAAAERFLDPDELITIKLLPAEGDVEPLKPPKDAGQTARRSRGVELVDLDNERLIRVFRSRSRDAETDGPAEVGPLEMRTLDNGLRVILQRNTRLPAVAMRWYHLGGLLADKPGREGVANAMAQMMMKGAGDRSADEIARTLARFGADMSSDAGNSTFHVQAQSLAEDWEPVLELMADVIRRPDFPQTQWEQMKPRILAEIDSVEDQWHRHLRSAFRSRYFGEGHPWSQPIAGRRGVIESLTAEKLKRFHRRRISAQNGVLAVIGDIQPDKVFGRVKELFADMRSEPEVALPSRSPDPPAPGVEVVSTSKPMAAVEIGYAPGMKRDNPDYPRMLVMNRVLSSFPTGWLDQALRGEGKGLVYAVGSGMMTGASRGYWATLFNTDPSSLKPAMSKTLDVIGRIRSEGIDDQTLHRARTAVAVEKALSRQSNPQRATQSALDELYGVGYDNTDRFLRRIRTVSAKQVQRVARRYLKHPVGVVLTNKKVDKSELPKLEPAGRSEEK